MCSFSCCFRCEMFRCVLILVVSVVRCSDVFFFLVVSVVRCSDVYFFLLCPLCDVQMCSFSCCVRCAMFRCVLFLVVSIVRCSDVFFFLVVSVVSVVRCLDVFFLLLCPL